MKICYIHPMNQARDSIRFFTTLSRIGNRRLITLNRGSTVN